MTKFYKGWLALSILIATAAQGCSGEVELHEAALTEAMQGVSRTFEKLADIMNESMGIQLRNSDALSELVSTIARGAQECRDCKEKLDQNDRKDETVMDYIQELKNQLKTQQEKVRLQEEWMTEYRQQVGNITESRERLQGTAQYLESRLIQLQQSELELKNAWKNFNKTVDSQNKTLGQDCTQPNLQEIKKLVQEFSRDRDWIKLKTKLLPLLDDNSEAYEQVSKIDALPMYFIGQNNYDELASLLLCAGMSVNALDNRGHAMLHGAAAGGQLHLAKTLLDLGASLNVMNIKGYTPLMKAAYYNHLKVAKMLLQAGADTAARNNEMLTALEIARKHRAGDVAEYLGQLQH